MFDQETQKHMISFDVRFLKVICFKTARLLVNNDLHFMCVHLLNILIFKMYSNSIKTFSTLVYFCDYNFFSTF